MYFFFDLGGLEGPRYRDDLAFLQTIRFPNKIKAEMANRALRGNSVARKLLQLIEGGDK